MNYNIPKALPEPRPETPLWHQAHCKTCSRRALSSDDMRKNFKVCYACDTVYCVNCMVSPNGYHLATEAFRSKDICPVCCRYSLLQSHIILQSKYKDLRDGLFYEILDNYNHILYKTVKHFDTYLDD